MKGGDNRGRPKNTIFYKSARKEGKPRRGGRYRGLDHHRNREEMASVDRKYARPERGLSLVHFQKTRILGTKSEATAVDRQVAQFFWRFLTKRTCRARPEKLTKQVPSRGRGRGAGEKRKTTRNEEGRIPG